MMTNESSHLYDSNNQEMVTSDGQRRIYSVNNGINNSINSNNSMMSFNDSFFMDVVSFIQGYQSDHFQFLPFGGKGYNYDIATSATILTASNLDDEMVQARIASGGDASINQLLQCMTFQELPIKIDNDKLPGISHSCIDLLNRFFIPLAKRVRFLQLVCDSVLDLGPGKLGQSIVDYCQKEVVNIVLVEYYNQLSVAANRINGVNNSSNSMALISLINNLNNLEEFLMIIDTVKVLEAYLNELNGKLKVDRDVAEFQMFMKTLKENKTYAGIENRNIDEDANVQNESDDWISYDTRLSETPQGNTVIALIWQYARIPFRKRNLPSFRNFEINSDDSKNSFTYIPGCKVIERFIYLFNDWILNGNLAYAENDCGSQFDFLVTDVLGYSSKLNNERLWEIKFNIMKDGLDNFSKFVLPSFNNKSLLKKFLEIGKLKHLYNIFASMSFVESELEKQLNWPILHLEIFENSIRFQSLINEHYENSNRLVLQMFEEKYSISKMIPNLLSFYLCQNNDNLFNFLNNSLLDLTRYPTEFNLRSLQIKFQILNQENGLGANSDWFNMVNLKFDELTVLDHINKFKLLQSDSSINGDKNRLEYDGNFQGFKKLILPSALTVNYDRDCIMPSNSSKFYSNNKLVSINFMKLQLDVPFPLSIILNKTLSMQLEMVQRKLMHYYYMEKIMTDIHIEINKNRFWILASKNSRIDILGIKKLHYKMRIFTKCLKEYVTNGVLLATKIPYVTENSTLAEYVFDLNNYLTGVMIKIWLTNGDISTCEYNIIQLIFQFCKFVTHLRHKLEQVLHSTDEEDSDIQELISSIRMKFNKYSRSFDEWLQLYIECVYAEFAKNNEGNNVAEALKNNKSFNGVYLKKFLRDLECILTF